MPPIDHPSHNYLPAMLAEMNGGLWGCMECGAETAEELRQRCPASLPPSPLAHDPVAQAVPASLRRRDVR